MVWDYSLRIARNGAKVRKVLYRPKYSKPQSDLDRIGRLQNVKETFCIDKRFVQGIRGKDIVLVDDLITSGATVHEAGIQLLAY